MIWHNLLIACLVLIPSIIVILVVLRQSRREEAFLRQAASNLSIATAKLRTIEAEVRRQQASDELSDEELQVAASLKSDHLPN